MLISVQFFGKNRGFQSETSTNYFINLHTYAFSGLTDFHTEVKKLVRYLTPKDFPLFQVFKQLKPLKLSDINKIDSKEKIAVFTFMQRKHQTEHMRMLIIIRSTFTFLFLQFLLTSYSKLPNPFQVLPFVSDLSQSCFGLSATHFLYSFSGLIAA